MSMEKYTCLIVHFDWPLENVNGKEEVSWFGRLWHWPRPNRFLRACLQEHVFIRDWPPTLFSLVHSLMPASHHYPRTLTFSWKVGSESSNMCAHMRERERNVEFYSSGSWRFPSSPRVEVSISQFCASLSTLFFHGLNAGPMFGFYFRLPSTFLGIRSLSSILITFRLA